jgi:hypothetical protein
MLKGIIIENSLADKSLLDKVQITETRQVGDWTLHDVLVPEDLVPEISKYISDGPWYIHLWQKGDDEFVILFKDKMFRVNASDPTSFTEAIAYGKSIGIPEEQLDFPII